MITNQNKKIIQHSNPKSFNKGEQFGINKKVGHIVDCKLI